MGPDLNKSRIIAIDYGTKRLGLAITDPLGLSACPLCVLEKSKNFKEDIDRLKEIFKNYAAISEIVVGLPKTMKGEIGQSAKEVLNFVEMLKQSFDIPIVTWDERLTSVCANRMFDEAGISFKKRRNIIDKSAACFILQNYLDFLRR